MMKGVDFIAIDFETAMPDLSSICEAGICVVRDGIIRKTRSWLVRPKDNRYCRKNMDIHGITPEDTQAAPPFYKVWAEIAKYLEDCPLLVAHNTKFDMNCIRQSLALSGIEKPDVICYCSLCAARHLYGADDNDLATLCNRFSIPQGTHHRAGNDAEMCAQLFLREIKDADLCKLEEMDFCKEKL